MSVRMRMGVASCALSLIAGLLLTGASVGSLPALREEDQNHTSARPLPVSREVRDVAQSESPEFVGDDVFDRMMYEGGASTVLTEISFPQIGVVYSVGSDMTTHFCTAFSIADEAHPDRIMTAGHCSLDSTIVFVPGMAGPHSAPHGKWPVVASAFYPGFDEGDAPSTEFDVMIADVQKAGDPTTSLFEEVGGLPLAYDALPNQSDVLEVGYPVDEQYPWACLNDVVGYAGGWGDFDGVDTEADSDADDDDAWYFRMDCSGGDEEGMSYGTSGSPWMVSDDSSPAGFAVVGVTGGAQDGGGLTDLVSYAVRLTSARRELIEGVTFGDDDHHGVASH